jgi:hypothetical protein
MDCLRGWSEANSSRKNGHNHAADLILGLPLLLPIALPIGALSWLAITILRLYVLLFTDHPRRDSAGPLILLATTVPMLWSRLLFLYFANFILESTLHWSACYWAPHTRATWFDLPINQEVS